MHKTLYEKVLDLCEKEGISIPELCRTEDIPESTVYTWKSRPTASPALDIAIKLANKFKVPIETFNIPKKKE